MVSVSVLQGHPAETGSFPYEANGNVKTAPALYSITNVPYGPANLPLPLPGSGTTTTHRYDDAGKRVAKQVAMENTEVYLREGATTFGVFTVSGSGALVSWYFRRQASAPIAAKFAALLDG